MSEIVKKPRTLTVQVISNRMDKTVVASIDKKVPHPKYGKYIKRRTKIFVHDPENSAKIGDVIIVSPSRPLSKKETLAISASGEEGGLSNMIQMQTKLLVADNSGAKLVKCIKVLGGSHRRYARIGDIIKISIQEALPRTKVQAGKVFNAVVVRARSGVRRKDGMTLKFGTNAVALLDDQLQLIGTRINGPAPHELRKRFMKLISLARTVV